MNGMTFDWVRFWVYLALAVIDMGLWVLIIAGIAKVVGGAL